MTDFETNPIGTEQALREAMELLGIRVEGSPVETWRAHKLTLSQTSYTRDLCQHKWTHQYPNGIICIYCNKTIMNDIQIADLIIRRWESEGGE